MIFLKNIRIAFNNIIIYCRNQENYNKLVVKKSFNARHDYIKRGFMDNVKKLFGKRLKEIRKSKKLTQEKLAELVGLDSQNISNIENGKYKPSDESLLKISKVLGVRPCELYAFEHWRDTNELIAEMVAQMQKNEALARMMYKIFIGIK